MRDMVPNRRAYDALKRVLDVTAAIAALTFGAPLMAVIACVVRVTMGHGVIYAQRRPGRGERLFTMYKFRTMRDAVGSDGQPLSDAERLTRFGRFLRSTSLDELPEFFNVLLGQMSVVGPRPLLTEYLPLYTEEQRRRHEIRPGITGWAQVNGRNELDWPERFALDVWYVDNRSLALDARIVLMTLAVALRREGISAPGEATMRRFDGASGKAGDAP